MPHNHYRSGSRKAGFINRILEDGSNGTADTTWDAGQKLKICVKLNAGLLLGVTLEPLKNTANLMITAVEKSNDKHYCTGLMIQETFKLFI
jgi:hypothetical protein